MANTAGEDETAYLLRSDENALRLLEAIESARAGEVTQHELVED